MTNKTLPRQSVTVRDNLIATLQVQIASAEAVLMIHTDASTHLIGWPDYGLFITQREANVVRPVPPMQADQYDSKVAADVVALTVKNGNGQRAESVQFLAALRTFVSKNRLLLAELQTQVGGTGKGRVQ